MAGRPYSRQRPWPYDAYVSDVKIMLVPEENGQLVSKKSKTLEATAPITYAYSSANPYKERTSIYELMFAGMGLSESDTASPRRYSHATNADLSIDGRWMKGPLFHEETIHASAGDVLYFIKALHSGSEVLFAICQNGVWRRTSDGNWSPSLTDSSLTPTTNLPTGQNPQQAVRFKGRYTSGIDGLYVATDSGYLWQYTGSAWVQASSTEGPGVATDPGEARYIERVDDELWVAGDYWVMKAEADPLLRASWGAPIYIGDQSGKITGIKQLDNSLHVFKEDGWYTINTDGESQEIFPHLRTSRSLTNGKQAKVWLSQMWVTFGGQLYRLSSNGTVEMDGLEMLADNTSPVRGKYVAGSGHNAWFMYEFYYNEINNTTYMIKHGAWATDPEQAAQAQAQYIDVHNGALCEWNAEVTGVEVIPGVHDATNDRLYVGFSDGTCQWMVLPRNSYDPARDAECEFTDQDSYVYVPLHHAGFKADNKLWQGISVYGTALSTTEWVEAEYRLTQFDTEDWTTLIDVANDDLQKFTISGQRLNFPITPPVYSKIIQLRFKLCKDPDLADSPVQLSPIVTGVAIHESVRPTLELEYTFNIAASSFLAKRNGTVDRRRGVAIRDALRDIAAEIGLITITLPDGEEEEVAVVDFDDAIGSTQKRRDLEYMIRMSFIQVRTLTPVAQETGVTYEQLEQYTLDELEAII